MISNLSSFGGGREAIHRLPASYPRYTETETDAKIAYFLSSGTRPITCKVIAEKGFRCPRFLDGSCSCKAPAAMAYQPPDVDVLRRAMNKPHTANRKYEDALAAQQFVERFMSNMEPAKAALFLQHELRPYLHLTTSEIKPVAAYQREL